MFLLFVNVFTGGQLGISMKCFATTIYMGILDESFSFEAIVYAGKCFLTKTKLFHRKTNGLIYPYMVVVPSLAPVVLYCIVLD